MSHEYVHQTHDLWRFFWVGMKVAPKTRFVSYTHTWEADGQYRWAPTLVVRIPFTRQALGFGVWLDSGVESLQLTAEQRKEIEEANALYAAYVAVNGHVERQEFDQARAAIAHLGLDPDEEMAMMQEEGVFL